MEYSAVTKWIKFALIVSILGIVTASPKDSAAHKKGDTAQKKELISKLQRSPLLDKKYLDKIFAHPSLKIKTTQPLESCTSFLENYNANYALKGKFSLEIGANYYKKNADIFKKAHIKYGVAPQYILAILRVETYLGICTGKYRILPKLYDFYIHSSQRKSFAFREMKAFLELSKKNNWNLFEIYGSSMGAIGTPQFLPSSIQKFAVDGDGDGKIDLFTPQDTVPSIANYLIINHWKISKKAAIWNYNRSRKYVNSVLTYAELIAKKI